MTTAGVVGLAGCMGGDGEDDEDGAQTEGSEVQMTIASTFEPGHILVEAANDFAEAINEESDGAIGAEVVPGGAYGSEDEIGEVVSDRGAEAHSAGTAPFFQYAPEYWFFGCPFVMESYDQLLAVMDSDLMAEAEELMIENGNQRPIGQQIYRGFRHYTANDPVQSPDDVQGMNLRLPEFEPWVAIWEEIGAEPTPVALDELYSALQTGTVDASEGPAEQVSSFNLQEVQSHYSLTRHCIETGNIYFNEEFFQELDQSHQDLVLEVGQRVTEEATQTAQDREQTLIDELDMELVDDVDIEAFQEAAAPAVEQLFDTQWAATWDDVRQMG